MHEEIIISGFGGQGILFFGKLLGTVGMKEGKRITFMPSYGAEVRGGTANCTIILSDKEISSPVCKNPSAVVVLNKPSMEKFEKVIKPGGLLIMNSSLIDREPVRSDIEVIKVPATDLAKSLGEPRVVNMIAYGAYIASRDVVSIDNSIAVLDSVISKDKKSLLEINKKAIKAGVEFVAKSKVREVAEVG